MAGATFGVMQSRIAKRLIDPSSIAVSITDVAQSINDAVDFWKTRKFYFNQNTVTVTLDPLDPYILRYGNSQTAYPNAPILPQDFLFEDPDNGFVILYANQKYRLKKEPQINIDGSYSNGNGMPYIYCFRNGNYEMYYLPQIAYSLVVNYYRDYQPLVSSSDNNDFTNFADKLIEYDAISRLLADLRLDDDRAERFNMRAQAEYDNLKSRSRKQEATGYMQVNSILD